MIAKDTMLDDSNWEIINRFMIGGRVHDVSGLGVYVSLGVLVNIGFWSE